MWQKQKDRRTSLIANQPNEEKTQSNESINLIDQPGVPSPTETSKPPASNRVPEAHRAANVFERLFAGWIDSMILFGPIVPVMMSFRQGLYSLVPEGVNILYALLFFGLILVFIYALFVSVFECTPMQASPGKYILGLRVEDNQGRRISPIQTILKTFVFFIFLLICQFTGTLIACLLYAVPLFAMKRTLYDLVLGRRVVKVRAMNKKWTAITVGASIPILILFNITDSSNVPSYKWEEGFNAKRVAWEKRYWENSKSSHPSKNEEETPELPAAEEHKRDQQCLLEELNETSKLLKSEPDNIGYLLARATINKQLMRWRDAQKDLERSFSLSNELYNSSTATELAYVKGKNGDVDGAVAVLERYRKSNRSIAKVALETEIDILEEHKQYANALKALDESDNLNSHKLAHALGIDQQSKLQRAVLLHKSNSDKQALSLAKQVVDEEQRLPQFVRILRTPKYFGEPALSAQAKSLIASIEQNGRH